MLGLRLIQIIKMVIGVEGTTSHYLDKIHFIDIYEPRGLNELTGDNIHSNC